MDLDALLTRYDAIPPDGEARLIERLIKEGWDAGCWLRPKHEQVITATQQELEELLGRLSTRASFERELKRLPAKP